MAKSSTVNKIENLQPDELNALKALVQEYITRKESVEAEIETLKEDLKTLDDEFKEKLDLKTLKVVVRVLKLEAEVAHRDAYDTFTAALTDPAQ